MQKRRIQPFLKEFISHPTAFPLDNCTERPTETPAVPKYCFRFLSSIFFILINILHFVSAFHWRLLFCMKGLSMKMSYSSECTGLPWSPASPSFPFTQSCPSSFMLYKKTYDDDFHSRFSIKITLLQATHLCLKLLMTEIRKKQGQKKLIAKYKTRERMAGSVSKRRKATSLYFFKYKYFITIQSKQSLHFSWGSRFKPSNIIHPFFDL